MLPVVLSVILVAMFLVYFFTKKSKMPMNKPPGPTPLPIIGCSYLVEKDTHPFVTFSSLTEKYGDMYSFKIGSTECVVVNSVKHIKSVLMQNGKFFAGRPDFIRFNALFGGDRKNSLALCDWDDLQVRKRNISRKHCDPKKYSHYNKIISDVGILELNELVQTLTVESIKANKRGEDVELKPFLMATSLNFFSQYMCSIRFDQSDPEFQQATKLFDDIFWEINQGYAVDFMPFLKPFYQSHFDKLSHWSQTIRNFILTRVINNRETNLDDSEEEKDFTDALLKLLKEDENNSDSQNEKFTRDTILFTLEDFLGGSAAIGNFVMITLGLIAKNPWIADEIRKEVDNVTGGLRNPTVEDGDCLPFTIATLKETLRYQSSPIVPHVAMETAKVEGYDIEKGTVILINNYRINMDDKLWSEPTKYNPDRFINRTYVDIKSERRGSGHDSGVESECEDRDLNKKKSVKQTHILSEEKATKKEIVTLKQNMNHFMPFSVGKRSCLGQGLLMKYSMVTVATILQNFDVSCRNPETIKTYTACVALPSKTFKLTLTPRQR